MPDVNGWVALSASALWLLVMYVTGRVNYRLGVADGWRAHRDPRDPLWNRQRAIVREYGEEAPDAR